MARRSLGHGPGGDTSGLTGVGDNNAVVMTPAGKRAYTPSGNGAQKKAPLSTPNPAGSSGAKVNKQAGRGPVPLKTGGAA
jgi:hypothetical protein